MQLIRRSFDVVRNRAFKRLTTANRLRRGLQEFAVSNSLTAEEKGVLTGVSPAIHPNDTMYSVCLSDEEYLCAGLSALRCILHCLNRAPVRRDMRTILDFPCGYGRVLRFLRARFPDADITVCDIDSQAVEFCGRVFAANPEMSNQDFRKLSISRKFDLVWCGSLFTHMDEVASTHLLRFFRDHLAPGGLCVFTTHGQLAAESIEKKLNTFGLTEDGQQQLLSGFEKRGYGYADYPGRCGVGTSLISPERMRALVASVGEWTEACYLEHGWDNIQDVYGYTVPHVL